MKSISLVTNLTLYFILVFHRNHSFLAFQITQMPSEAGVGVGPVPVRCMFMTRSYLRVCYSYRFRVCYSFHFLLCPAGRLNRAPTRKVIGVQ
jgi:hypothetical protein